ncbi:MAG: DUF192 domain-containing protein [bacterium]|nr:DUF192 domain-containing protein [bacterium]
MDCELRKKTFWIGAVLIILGGVWLFFDVWESNSQTLEVRVGGSVILAEVADSAEERARGLSGRNRLEKGRGMIFLFDPSASRSDSEESSDSKSSGQAQPAVQGFWMKDMRFPIDIIWIRDGIVIGFEESVPAPAISVSESELPVYVSPGKVDMVLEISSGEVERLGIEVGDKFEVVI